MMNRIASSIIVMTLAGGCASQDVKTAFFDLEPSRLPKPDVSINIAGLGPCTDSPNRSLHFDSSQPITVLVHGCYGSSGQFRGLAQVLAFHGQQSACYTYDDRAALDDSAAELRRALKQLVEQSRAPKITVTGHSQGALVARRSLTDFSPAPFPTRALDLNLVTISGPFSGIEAARPCGTKWLYPLTLGLLPLSCYIGTGPKWADITFSSDFIREPGLLAPQVRSYLKIDTDERDTCRLMQGERCVETDDIFSLTEQRNSQVEADARVKRVELNAGHVEIVGDRRVAPTKLITLLQSEGVLRPTAIGQMAAFRVLLSRVYESGGASP